MKVDHFDPPGNNADLGDDADLKKQWNAWMSREFGTGVLSVQKYLDHHGGGTCQFYNPLTDPLAERRLFADGATRKGGGGGLTAQWRSSPTTRGFFLRGSL